MKDRDHNEGMAELFQQDARFAAEYLRQCLTTGTPADVRAGLRQMSGLLVNPENAGGSDAAPATGLFDRSGVRYEVACDVIGALIAHYAEIMGKERDRAQPDEAILRVAGALKSALAAERDDLNQRDSAGIEAAISRYAPLARRLYGDGAMDAGRQAQRRADFDQANASLALEGLVMNDDDRAVQALLIRGDITHDEAVQCYRILCRHSR